jgi:hypothetical protein
LRLVSDQADFLAYLLSSMGLTILIVWPQTGPSAWVRERVLRRALPGRAKEVLDCYICCGFWAGWRCRRCGGMPSIGCGAGWDASLRRRCSGRRWKGRDDRWSKSWPICQVVRENPWRRAQAAARN